MQPEQVEIIETAGGLSLRVKHPQTGEYWTAALVKEGPHRDDLPDPERFCKPIKFDKPYFQRGKA